MTLEGLPGSRLKEMVTDEEELNAVGTENSSWTKVQNLKAKQKVWVSFASLVEELKKVEDA